METNMVHITKVFLTNKVNKIYFKLIHNIYPFKNFLQFFFLSKEH